MTNPSDVSARLDHAHQQIANLQELLRADMATIARIWSALGIKTYKQAGGKEISEIVADLKAHADSQAKLLAEREWRLDCATKALMLIAGFAGQTLISMEHGQPYSIGANAAFEDAASIAAEALANPSPPKLSEPT